MDLKPVSIVTHRFEVRRFADREIHFEAEVSTGTYVRALARDLGADLGCYAHLSRLRRTAIGPFHVDMAVSPRDLETGPPTEAGWLSPAEGLSWLPGRQLSPEEIERVLVGQSLSCRADHPDCDLPVPLLAGDRLVAVARSVSGELKPEKVFPGG